MPRKSAARSARVAWARPSSSGFSSGRPRRSASAIAAFSQSHALDCHDRLLHRDRDAVAQRHRCRHELRMRVEALVVLGDRARVVGVLAAALAMKPGTTSPSHSTLSVTSSPPGRSRSTSRSSIGDVERLVAVLKDQIERPRDLGDQQLRVADDDADAVGERRRARSSPARPARARGPSPSSAACRPAAARRRARCPSSRSPCRSRGCASAPTASRQHAQQRADFGVDERQVLLVAVARDVVEHRVAEAVQSAR